MNLEDLLTELRENILYDRSDRIAGTSDYLWSDETLVRYINEAHVRFARDGLVIRDNTTPSVTQVTLATGVTQYKLDDSVLAIISARLTGDTGDLVRTGHSMLDSFVPPDSYFFDPNSIGQLAPGKPVAFTTDETIAYDSRSTSVNSTVFRVYPTPSAAYNGQIINLRVVRLPLNKFTINNLKATPEIPEMHHMEMLDWAASLALRVVDADAGNKKRSDDFAATFELNVMRAKKAVMRKLFTPQGFGFGRNGFSWEH